MQSVCRWYGHEPGGRQLSFHQTCGYLPSWKALGCFLFTTTMTICDIFLALADSTNLPSILSTIAARCHSIFGHIHCLPDSTPAHKALKLAVDSRSGDTPHHDWNRPAGRPRTTWMSQIVRDTGLTAADDAWALANDRSTWRALRPTAGYAQQWVSEWEWLSSQLENITAVRLAPDYAAWWQRHVCVNNLPRVVMTMSMSNVDLCSTVSYQTCNAMSKPLIVSSMAKSWNLDFQSDTLTTAPPSRWSLGGQESIPSWSVASIS